MLRVCVLTLPSVISSASGFGQRLALHLFAPLVGGHARLHALGVTPLLSTSQRT
jgi:hypothetical protein